MKLRNKMVMMGVLAALPLASQAGMSVKFDDTSNGVGWDYIVADEGAGDGLSGPGLSGIMDGDYITANGIFGVLAESGAPSDWTLTDIQFTTNIAAGTTWVVEVIDDSFVGSGTELFKTVTSPSKIENGTVGVVTEVEGTTIYSNPDMDLNVAYEGVASVALSDPFEIKHTFTFTNTSSTTAKFTVDTNTYAVSEPGALALVGLALAGLGFRRKSKKS